VNTKPYTLAANQNYIKMAFERSQMLYDNGTYYKWVARADHDNPYYRGGTDAAELNRTEGYEILYFITHLAKKKGSENLNTYQKFERMIRNDVPSGTRKRNDIEAWLFSHWN
jgi:hypothetical protein